MSSINDIDTYINDINTYINGIASKLIGLNDPLRRRFRRRIKHNFDRINTAFKKELGKLSDIERTWIYDDVFFGFKTAYNPNLFYGSNPLYRPVSELHKKVINAKIILVNTDIILCELNESTKQNAPQEKAIIKYSDGSIVPVDSLDYLILRNIYDSFSSES